VNRLSRQRGAFALEFAFVFPIALLLLGAIMYLGMNAAYSGLAEHGVRKAARFGSIRSLASGTYPSDAEIRSIGARVDTLLGTPLSVTVVRQTGAGSTRVACNLSGSTRRCGDGDVITVTATYDSGVLAALARLVPGVPDEVTRTATARFE
jgi:Flp pilus assembly protein TadG